MVPFSDDPIDRVIYVSGATQAEEYCALSGATLYSGNSDYEITLSSKVT